MYTHVYKLSVHICEFPEASQCDSQTQVDGAHLFINNDVSVSFPEPVRASTSKPRSQWAKSLQTGRGGLECIPLGSSLAGSKEDKGIFKHGSDGEGSQNE